jgi:hypothetical protein
MSSIALWLFVFLGASFFSIKRQTRVKPCRVDFICATTKEIKTTIIGGYHSQQLFLQIGEVKNLLTDITFDHSFYLKNL